MRIFVTKWFDRFQRSERIADAALIEAIDRASLGLIDAKLGAHLIKQRIAKSGQGKSGGYRTIVVLKSPEMAVFVYGFSKNTRANISSSELAEFKELALFYLAQSTTVMDEALKRKAIREIEYGARPL
jgi:hypothetical protein